MVLMFTAREGPARDGRACVVLNAATMPAPKAELLAAIAAYDEATSIDGVPSVDFGVSGGELDKDSRAPRDLLKAGAFYGVSERVGKAADHCRLGECARVAGRKLGAVAIERRRVEVRRVPLVAHG